MDNRPHALYRFFAADGSLLYVGITLDVSSRWKTHSKDKPWWGEIVGATLEHFPDRQTALDAERAAIINERPRYNVVHNAARSAVGVTLAQRVFGASRTIRADDMPDCCHDYCAKQFPDDLPCFYYPYRWHRGIAHYICERGHRWTCGWGWDGGAVGEAPEMAGVGIR